MMTPQSPTIISIHVLREEDDNNIDPMESIVFIFQSTSSARRTTDVSFRAGWDDYISIHVLREEDDLHSIIHPGIRFEISIHVLREEDDGDCI